VPANLVRVATGQACRVVLGPGRVKRAARIGAQLLPGLRRAAAAGGCLGRGPRCLVCSYLLASYCSACSYSLVSYCSACSYSRSCCLGRAAWTWCRWLPAQLVPGPRAWSRWLPADLVAQLLPVAAWSRSCCLVVFVFVLLVGPCL
jgi:hypothetical protein